MKTNINIFNNLNESLERELNNKRKSREIVKSRKEKKLTESTKLNEEEYSFEEIITRMSNATDYSELYDAASLIKNDSLRTDVEQAIDQCESDGDTVEEAYSIVTSDILDMYVNDLNESKKFSSNKKLTEATVIWDSEPTFDDEEDAEDYDYDLWLEDFNLNVLPDIKNQCRNDILIMAGTVGRWNGNFSGGTVIDVDDLLGIEDVDSVRLINDNGNIVWEGSHHDGTHSMGLYTVPNDLEARKKIVYDLGIIDWLKDMYYYESEEYCVEDALDRLDSIGDLKDILTPEDYTKVPEYFTPIKVTGNMPQIKESEELKEDNSNISDLANEIINFYDSDMGTHFDEVLGHEEEIYNETLAMLENKEDNKEVIKRIISEIRDSETDEELANKLEAYLNESVLREYEEYEAAKYKGKEWGIFAKKSNSWVVFGTEKEMKERAKELNNKAKEDLKEEDIIKINQVDTEPDYLIQDVTVLNQVGDGDVQSPDIEALLTLVDSELKENCSENWGRIKTLSSKIDENTSYALVDISTPEILKELDSKGIKDAAIGKNLILEKVDNKLVEFKVNNLNGTTKYSKKTTNPQKVIYEWLESEFLQEAKEEKAKEAEVARVKTEKETVENYINNRLDLRMEIENIKMFIELSKEVKAEEEMKPTIQNRMYAFAAEVPHQIEVNNNDNKYELSFSTLDEVVTIVFGKEWVKEPTPDNEVVGVIKESYKAVATVSKPHEEPWEVVIVSNIKSKDDPDMKQAIDSFKKTYKDSEIKVEDIKIIKESALPNISKFIYDLDKDKGNAWSAQSYTKDGRGNKIIIVSRNGESENTAKDIKKAVEKKYPNLKGEITVNKKGIWFYLTEAADTLIKESEDKFKDMVMELHGYIEANPQTISSDLKKAIKNKTVDDYLSTKAGMSFEEIEDFMNRYSLTESQKINESYEQFNIGEIEVVFNPDTYETLYSIPSADVQDKKINLTKIPTVDTPYDTDTIIKSYIETRFGRIPSEEEKEMIDDEEDSESAPESPEIPQEEETPQDDININEPDLTEDELPDEPEENEVPTEAEPEEETPEAETGSAVFMKFI